MVQGTTSTQAGAQASGHVGRGDGRADDVLDILDMQRGKPSRNEGGRPAQLLRQRERAWSSPHSSGAPCLVTKVAFSINIFSRSTIGKRSSTSPRPSSSGGFVFWFMYARSPRNLNAERRSLQESTPHRHHLAKAGENNAEVYAARFRSLARGRLPCRTAARAHQAHGGGSGAALLPRYITPLAPLPFPPPLS